ncbi:SURF4-domain-containing protein [Basidiobolus meristosporus CBS 931.73]|uniref:SURF4-domain-containing protein n=1 Tax=Basidiobolus meristosporus CBS 931.73 TaxID=1314790 RepID=A0A1Y1Z8S1_9FUNG|nr:SURF4-domain-containing protein [Basidiobolus meristosporus CBS 931.73]|eukprot:ORY06606.1 SURF4-domain-containing protein [Basidiobolus meristosporus CBS 931.73]
MKSYIPSVARFLVVVSFIEDSSRILSQWTEQLHYLQYQRGISPQIGHAFLLLNVLIMLSGSFLAITKKHMKIAIGGLFLAVISQVIGYGLFLEFQFFLRNISILGGLLMLLAEGLNKPKSCFPGLLAPYHVDPRRYLQLSGRVLLIVLFLYMVFPQDATPLNLTLAAVGIISSLMIVVGFKVKFSAVLMAFSLTIFNIVKNNWWTIHHNHPARDYLRYDFFQVLSIVGGLLLLVNVGPGTLSLDGKEKKF